MEPYDSWMEAGLDEHLRRVFHRRTKMQYEYECTKCYDVIVSFNSVDERHTESPECPRDGYETVLVTSVPATPVMNPARPVKRAHNA